MKSGTAGRLGAALILSLAGADTVFGEDANTIVQNGRAFHPNELTITAGSTLNFSNKDEFIHQIYVDNKDFDYDSAEQPPGVVFHITFPSAGTYAIRCHIHPKMLLTVHVK
ncbi:MAG TPA: cupredoxin domain-containing protein [Rhizomicrobium sp.]|jgi:plastocyanin|nr:cupredoxin domain-containing protein [Rhizomicrobium sp.]